MDIRIFLPEDRSRVRVYLFVFFLFPRDDRIDPEVLECCKRAQSNGTKNSSALFKWPKNWMAPRSPPTLIFSPKSLDQNSEIAILFTVVEKPNNYVFKDDLLPNSLRGRGYKLQLWPVFTYSNGYWEVHRRFQGDFLFGERRSWGGFFPWRIFPWRNLSWGKIISMKHDCMIF